MVSVETTGPFGVLLAAILGLPAHGAVAAVLKVEPLTSHEEIWTRRFGNKVRRTSVRWTEEGMVERLGPITLVFEQTSAGVLRLRRSRPLGGRAAGVVDIQASTDQNPEGFTSKIDITLGGGRFGRCTYVARMLEGNPR